MGGGGVLWEVTISVATMCLYLGLGEEKSLPSLLLPLDEHLAHMSCIIIGIAPAGIKTQNIARNARIIAIIASGVWTQGVGRTTWGLRHDLLVFFSDAWMKSIVDAQRHLCARCAYLASRRIALTPLFDITTSRTRNAVNSYLITIRALWRGERRDAKYQGKHVSNKRLKAGRPNNGETGVI